MSDSLQLVDSNVLIYAHDVSVGAKQAIQLYDGVEVRNPFAVS